MLSQTVFEKNIIIESVNSDNVLAYINYSAYFELAKHPLPDTKNGILDRLISEKIIVRKGVDDYSITNMGAVLLAKDLRSFDLDRKAVRVILYKGNNRIHTQREQVFSKGYAAGFEELISFINSILPHNELIGQALRTEHPMYPELAVRELVANSVIHQDFSFHGPGPMVEIFSDRIEITNPGEPLIDTKRFLDAPPRSRNDNLASFLRRINICEERDSGIDKVVFQVELFQLPAPDFLVTNQHTKAVLFAPKKLNNMSKDDRIRACYQHAALQYVSNQQMTNTSLRKRFGIEDKNYAVASRIISDTIEVGLVQPSDPENRSRKHASYKPFWA